MFNIGAYSQHLDQMVLAKPYFDAEGLILALDDGQPIGFAHFGFGPNELQSDINHETGVLAQIRVIDCENRNQIAGELISEGMSYLRQRGAKECFAGAQFPFSPFYMGLYGGSRVPGIPCEDEFTNRICRAAGFELVQKIFVFQRSLIGFRPIVNRVQLALRRQYQVIQSSIRCCRAGGNAAHSVLPRYLDLECQSEAVRM